MRVSLAGHILYLVKMKYCKGRILPPSLTHPLKLGRATPFSLLLALLLQTSAQGPIFAPGSATDQLLDHGKGLPDASSGSLSYFNLFLPTLTG